jgi:hypothetical protein
LIATLCPIHRSRDRRGLAEPFAPIVVLGVDLTGRGVNPDKATKQDVLVRTSGVARGKNQQPAAFSRDGLFYVPTNNLCMDYKDARWRISRARISERTLGKARRATTERVHRRDATTGKKIGGSEPFRSGAVPW